MRETRQLRFLRGGLMYVCAGLTAALCACSSDDERPAWFDGGAGGSPVLDAAKDSTTADPSAKDAADGSSDTGAAGAGGTQTSEAGSAGGAGGSPSLDASDAGTGGASNDSGPGADATDARSDTAVDSSPHDGSAEASAPALALCPTLDTAWSIANGAAGCETQTLASTCPDRAGTWGNDIAIAGFATMVAGDCRISQMYDSLSTDDQSNYLEALIRWTVSFFGCPYEGLTVPIYGLIPSAQSSHVFTTADIDALKEMFVDSVQTALTAAPGTATSLTAADLAAIHDRLAWMAARYPASVETSSTYSFNACTPDAGGGDAAGD